MVKLTIQQAAKAHGVMNAYQLQKAMKTSPGIAARLWRGDLTMIGLRTLDALCAALECDLGEIITRETDKPKKGRARNVN